MPHARLKRVTDYNERTETKQGELASRRGWLTGEGALVEALLDAVGAAHVEGLGDLLVHEALAVQDVGHHHAQVKHLQQLGDGGHLHQVPAALVQAARVEVLEHGLMPQEDMTLLSPMFRMPL